MNKVQGAIIVFVSVFVVTMFLPLIPLHKGDVVIGHFPLYMAYLDPHGWGWRYIWLHLLVNFVSAAGCLLGWRFFRSKEETISNLR